jgi:hypothetical protein
MGFGDFSVVYVRILFGNLDFRVYYFFLDGLEFSFLKLLDVAWATALTSLNVI